MVNKLTKIAYHIFHCDADTAVNINSHSKKFVSAMKENGQDITFDIIHGREHCDLTDNMREKFTQYCIDAIERVVY